MKTANPLHKNVVAIVLATLVVTTLGALQSDTAEATRYARAAEVEIWIDRTWDVFPSYNDVTIYVRASRDCYATVFVVDTDGYVHVVHPFSPYESAWIYAGETYGFSGAEMGFGAYGGHGIAYAFAVTSPWAFQYGSYGAGVFAGQFGYRVYGDPYVACRDLYVSLLPGRCDRDLIGVGATRFYVRKWARYPNYLCHGHGVTVTFGSNHHRCRRCEPIYEDYDWHVRDPYRVISPTVAYKGRHQTRVTVTSTESRSRVKGRKVGVSRTTKVTRTYARTHKATAKGARVVSSKKTNKVRLSHRNKVATRAKVRTQGRSVIAKDPSKVRARGARTSGPTKVQSRTKVYQKTKRVGARERTGSRAPSKNKKSRKAR